MEFTMTFDLLQFNVLAFSIFPKLVLVLEFVLVLLHFIADVLQENQLIFQLAAAGIQASNSLPRCVNLRLNLRKLCHFGEKLIDICQLLTQLRCDFSSQRVNFLKQTHRHVNAKFAGNA